MAEYSSKDGRRPSQVLKEGVPAESCHHVHTHSGAFWRWHSAARVSFHLPYQWQAAIRVAEPLKALARPGYGDGVITGRLGHNEQLGGLKASNGDPAGLLPTQVDLNRHRRTAAFAGAVAVLAGGSTEQFACGGDGDRTQRKWSSWTARVASVAA